MTVNGSALISAGEQIFAIKGESDAQAWLNRWSDALDDQPFWSAQGTSAMSRIMAIRVGLLPVYAIAKARLAPPAKASVKAPAARGERTVGEGAVLANCALSGASDPFASKRFVSAYKAREWAAKQLVEKGDMGSTATIADSRSRSECAVLTRDDAMRLVFGGDPSVSVRATEAPADKRPTPVAEDASFVRCHARRTPASDWQKVGNDRSHFSGADKSQERRESTRK